MDSSILDEKKQVLLEDYVPSYEQLIIHPEEGETFEINNSMYDIHNDMQHIDALIINQAILLQKLLDDTTDRLNTIDINVKAEQERLQDIKMLCNKYTDFDNVVPITSNTSSYGDYSMDNDTIYCYVKSASQVKTTIIDIVGNGLEGNKYVYKNNEYLQDIMDTSKRKNLVDGSRTSYYEYERITASSYEPYLLSDFNIDSEPARCTVSMSSSKDINVLTVDSDDNTVRIVGLQYSKDGVHYTPVSIPDIIINNKQYCYENSDYICGDNKVSFPTCKYIKATFQSVGTTDDIIAYDRVMFSHEDVHKTLEETGQNYIPVTTSRAEYNDLIDATIVVDSAKRHNIRLNDLKLARHAYLPYSSYSTNNLVSGGTYYSVAVFANIYIPAGLKSNCVKFILHINGLDYVAVPINISGPGKKVFRYSQGKSKTEYTTQLDEPIKNVSLTIQMDGTQNLSPFVSNVKILLGGEL